MSVAIWTKIWKVFGKHLEWVCYRHVLIPGAEGLGPGRGWEAGSAVLPVGAAGIFDAGAARHPAR